MKQGSYSRSIKLTLKVVVACLVGGSCVDGTDVMEIRTSHLPKTIRPTVSGGGGFMSNLKIEGRRRSSGYQKNWPLEA
jgi:hypothetical protein